MENLSQKLNWVRMQFPDIIIIISKQDTKLLLQIKRHTSVRDNFDERCMGLLKTDSNNEHLATIGSRYSNSLRYTTFILVSK